MITLATDLKFCVNCEHVASSYSGDSDRYRCLAPENVASKTINLVTGREEKKYEVPMCADARTNENYCGRSAKWFKEKVPLISLMKEQEPQRLSKKSPISADDL